MPVFQQFCDPAQMPSVAVKTARKYYKPSPRKLIVRDAADWDKGLLTIQTVQ